MATRVERVVLELESNLTTGLARDAAAAALLKRELSGLDSSNTRATSSSRLLGNETERTGQKLTRTANATRGLSREAVQGTSEIDRYSGRLTVLAQVAAGLGPALIPIGAVGIPAAAGLANELSGVALGAGAALLAFHDLGPALTALNRAALDPSVTNLKAAHEALLKIPPAARDFARELSSLQPVLLNIRQAAAGGLFPGLSAAIADLSTRSGEVEHVLHRVGETLGTLAAEGAHALAGPEWDQFFNFVGQEAPVALANLGHAVGNVVHGLAQLWIAFAPLDQGFTRFVNDAAAGFDRWASGLSRTQGFQDFVAYLHTNGPLVAQAVESIANAVVQIVEAAAPLGGPILHTITALANLVASIANSSAGPTILQTVTALALLSRAQAAFGRVANSSWVQAVRGAEGYQAKLTALRGPAIRGGLALTGLGIAASGLGDHFKFANTASLALTGSLAGPWGAAVGAGVGLLLDFTRHTDNSAAATADFTDTLNQQNGAITENTRLKAAQALQDDGAFQKAQQLGIGIGALTDAALGNKAAMQQVNDQLAFYLHQTTPGYTAGGANIIPPEMVKAAGDLSGELGTLRGHLQGDQAKTRELAAAMDTGGKAAERAKRQHHALRLELAAEKQAAAETAGKFLTLGDNLNNAKVSLDKWVHQLANEAKALENFGTNAKTAADKGLRDGLIKELQQAGPEGALRLKQLANASEREIARANRAWASGKRATQDYQDAVAYVNNHPATIYVNGVPQSIKAIRAVQSELAGLRDHTIRVTTIRTTGGHSVAGYATGGTIPGARAPYGDRVLTMLAPGEEVISNRYGQADEHRALLKAINSRRYADGGTVAQSRVTVNVAGATMARGGSDIDYGQLAAAMAAMRPAPPLYGDVKLQPHNYSEFVRQMEQDRAMASLSGVRR